MLPFTKRFIPIVVSAVATAAFALTPAIGSAQCVPDTLIYLGDVVGLAPGQFLHVSVASFI